jgi:hypothetical protein
MNFATSQRGCLSHGLPAGSSAGVEFGASAQGWLVAIRFADETSSQPRMHTPVSVGEGSRIVSRLRGYRMTSGKDQHFNASPIRRSKRVMGVKPQSRSRSACPIPYLDGPVERISSVLAPTLSPDVR